MTIICTFGEPPAPEPGLHDHLVAQLLGIAAKDPRGVIVTVTIETRSRAPEDRIMAQTETLATPDLIRAGSAALASHA